MVKLHGSVAKQGMTVERRSCEQSESMTIGKTNIVTESTEPTIDPSSLPIVSSKNKGPSQSEGGHLLRYTTEVRWPACRFHPGKPYRRHRAFRSLLMPDAQNTAALNSNAMHYS